MRDLWLRLAVISIGAVTGTLLAPASATTPSGPPTPSAASEPKSFAHSTSPLSTELVATMKEHSWRDGCPVPLSDLVHLKLSHVGYDDAVHAGELVVHRDVASEVVEIFEALFRARFPIERMRLIEHYRGDDNASMNDNNSSAFNCRKMTGNSQAFSRHAYGRAIDLNPKMNPMVVGKVVLPSIAKLYVNRDNPAVGLITRRSSCRAEFVKRGWHWGGDFSRHKDYQHFEKR